MNSTQAHTPTYVRGSKLIDVILTTKTFQPYIQTARILPVDTISQ